MFILKSEKIYNVFEKPEAAEPTERVALLREGFALWAFVFGAVWLVVKRQWLLLAGYLIVTIALSFLCRALNLSEISVFLVNMWLQLMLAYHVADLQAWVLTRKGYRFAGVLVAESEMHAERRYYEFAA